MNISTPATIMPKIRTQTMKSDASSSASVSFILLFIKVFLKITLYLLLALLWLIFVYLLVLNVEAGLAHEALS